LGKTGEEIDRTCLKMLNDSNEQTVLERGLTCREELTLNKVGATRCFDSIMVPLKEENGVIAGLVVMGRDISTRKEIEASLLESQNVLELRSKELEETNSALRIILRQSEANKKEMEEQMSSNIRQLVMPYLQLLKKEIKANDNMAYLNIIETNLREICSSFSAKLSHRYAELSPKEILVANLVKEGRQDKSIAEALYLSVGTIKAHRRNIRKKLGIAGKKTNLRVFLSPLENE
jgi:DNA-binding CsgD family transcriptional regulator